MMKNVLLIYVITIATCCFFPVNAGYGSDGSIDNHKTEKQSIDQQWLMMKSQIDDQWDAMQKAQAEEWERLKAEVERKWQEYIYSTKTDWVDYNQQRDTRSLVDFKEGNIVFETVVPEGDPKALETAKSSIREQAEKVFTEKDITANRILVNQIVNKSGSKIEPGNLENYLKEEVLPCLKSDPLPFQSRDGVMRRKYTFQVKMVPNQIQIRAKKYLPIVLKNAERFGLKPHLILAVIHTESSFNPMAVSSCEAIGIMQIIPKYAGREAFHFLYGLKNPISKEYLFNPENNIEIGSAYLHLLKSKHFADVKTDIKNCYVTICGYNWGPTAVRKQILSKHPINKMNDEEVYLLLRQRAPIETKDYLKMVRERMTLYENFMIGG